MNLVAGILLLLAAQESREGETVRYRELGEILTEIGRRVADPSKGPPSLVWVVENSDSFKGRHAAILAEALPRLFGKDAAFHSVVAFANPPRTIEKGTGDPVKAAAAFLALAEEPADASVKNCLPALREAVRLAGGSGGKGGRTVVFFTQANADSEDDVEGTVAMFRKTGTTLFPIVPEAICSDPYWTAGMNGTTRYFNHAPFKALGFDLKGPESAYIEFPYGWPLVPADPCTTVPSSFPPWAIGRIAAQTGGRSFIYAAERAKVSYCQKYKICLLCTGEHHACGAAFNEVMLKEAAPELGSRPECLRTWSRDGLVSACFATWERLHKKGILRGPPPLQWSAAGLAEREGTAAPLSWVNGNQTAHWNEIVAAARRAEREVAEAGVELQKVAESLRKRADPRSQGTADAFLVHLRLLACAYDQLALFGEEMDRGRRAAPEAAATEAGTFARSRFAEFAAMPKIIGYELRIVSLCHGGGPVKAIRFLGGEASLRKIHDALDFADRAIGRHQGTPWETLARHATLPIFRPSDPSPSGGPAPVPVPKVASDGSGTATSPTRPDRAGQEGGQGGTATGP